MTVEYTGTGQQTLENIMNGGELTQRELSPLVKDTYRSGALVEYVQPKTLYRPWNANEQRIVDELRSDDFKELGFDLSNLVESKEFIIKKDDGKLHSIFPDVYSKKYRLAIEYDGGEGIAGEDERYAAKREVYRKNGVKLFTIHRDELRTGAWKERLKKELLPEEVEEDSESGGFGWLLAALGLGLLGLPILAP